jgi:hypothetical protein
MKVIVRFAATRTSRNSTSQRAQHWWITTIAAITIITLDFLANTFHTTHQRQHCVIGRERTQRLAALELSCWLQ